MREPDEKGVATVYTPGGSQEMLTVTEPGLYRLIFKSRKEVAKRFQRWVFHEVLPAIRKTGSYTLPQPDIECLKLELALAQTQERLMLTSQAIATMHGTGMLALILGKPDAVVTQIEVVEKTIAVDPKTGRVISESDGVTIGYLTKRLGFKNNDQTWKWLNSVGLGKDSGVWSKELTAHSTLKLPRRFIPEVQRLFAQKAGSRQLLLGEGRVR